MSNGITAQGVEVWSKELLGNRDYKFRSRGIWLIRIEWPSNEVR